MSDVELSKKVIKQIHFYFSNQNLRRDRFLQEKIKENDQGYVQLDVLLTFNKLKSMTTDKALIAKFIRESSDIIQVSEDGEAIKRKDQIPDELPNTIDCSIYIEKIPFEITIDEVEEAINSLNLGVSKFIKFLNVPKLTTDFIEEEDNKKANENLTKDLTVEFESPEICKKFLEEVKDSLKIKEHQVEKVKEMREYLSSIRKQIGMIDNKPVGSKLGSVIGCVLELSGMLKQIEVKTIKSLISRDDGLHFVDTDYNQIFKTPAISSKPATTETTNTTETTKGEEEEKETPKAEEEEEEKKETPKVEEETPKVEEPEEFRAALRFDSSENCEKAMEFLIKLNNDEENKDIQFKAIKILKDEDLKVYENFANAQKAKRRNSSNKRDRKSYNGGNRRGNGRGGRNNNRGGKKQRR